MIIAHLSFEAQVYSGYRQCSRKYPSTLKASPASTPTCPPPLPSSKIQNKPLKSQPEARDVKAGQNGLEIKAIEDVSIAIISKNPDAINEPMYCK
jgi:hypothetical protein